MGVISFKEFEESIGVPDALKCDFFKTYPNPFLIRNDLPFLLGIVEKFKPRNFVEFGLNKGYTAKIILDFAPWIEKYYGIDVLPGFKTGIDYQQREIPLEAGKACSDSRLIKIVTKNGSEDVTPEMISCVDMAFIDADHSYEGVKRDTEIVEQAMKSGGVIIWHDYFMMRTQVKKFIDERIEKGNNVCIVKCTNMCFEIVD